MSSFGDYGVRHRGNLTKNAVAQIQATDMLEETHFIMNRQNKSIKAACLRSSVAQPLMYMVQELFR